MYRAVKGTKICSAPRIFRINCKLFMCAKEKHKTKRDTPPYVNIYFTFYRNIKFYSKSLKHTSFSTWFDSSRIQICCVKTIIVTCTKNGFASNLFVHFEMKARHVAAPTWK